MPTTANTTATYRTKAARFEGRVQFAQHPRQFPGGNVEQRSVGEHAVETRGRQVQLQEILLPDLAAAVCARHGGVVGRARFERFSLPWRTSGGDCPAPRQERSFYVLLVDGHRLGNLLHRSGT